MDFYDQIDAATVGNSFAVVGNFGGPNFAEMNRGVTPLFHKSAIPNPAKSEEAGRPIFDIVEEVMIHTAGSFDGPNSPVDDGIKQRFAAEYKAWKESGENQILEGTPIDQWPACSVQNIAEFRALKIFTVEALAAVPEVHLSKMMGMREWRDRAAAWLESAADGASASKYAAENGRLREQVGVLEKNLHDLATRFRNMEMNSARELANGLPESVRERLEAPAQGPDNSAAILAALTTLSERMAVIEERKPVVTTKRPRGRPAAARKD